MGSTVSFVVATYGRPEVLDATLRALLLQRCPDWEAVVVGDCCDARTEAVVRAVGDRRIRFYNLPARYGEQGGPNSVGLAVARGELVTFLNHDDLLVPDHLDHVLARFGSGRVDVLATQFVKVRRFRAVAGHEPEIVCGARVPGRVRKSDLIGHDMHRTEPSSAWTIRRSEAVRVGPWRSSQSMTRLPFQDWLLRLSRTARSWRIDDRVTGLSLLGDYRRQAPEALALVGRLERLTPDEIREAFPPQPTPTEAPVGSGVLRTAHRLDDLMAPLGRVAYRLTGFDYGPQPARLRRRHRGRNARELLVARTGEEMPDHSRLPGYLDDPEALRVF